MRIACVWFVWLYDQLENHFVYIIKHYLLSKWTKERVRERERRWFVSVFFSFSAGSKDRFSSDVKYNRTVWWLFTVRKQFFQCSSFENGWPKSSGELMRRSFHVIHMNIAQIVKHKMLSGSFVIQTCFGIRNCCICWCLTQFPAACPKRCFCFH